MERNDDARMEAPHCSVSLAEELVTTVRIEGSLSMINYDLISRYDMVAILESHRFAESLRPHRHKSNESSR